MVPDERGGLLRFGLGDHVLALQIDHGELGAEPAGHTFVNTTADTSRELIGGIAAYAGVDPVSPIAEAASSAPVNSLK